MRALQPGEQVGFGTYDVQNVTQILTPVGTMNQTIQKRTVNWVNNQQPGFQRTSRFEQQRG